MQCKGMNEVGRKKRIKAAENTKVERLNEEISGRCGPMRREERDVSSQTATYN